MLQVKKERNAKKKKKRKKHLSCSAFFVWRICELANSRCVPYKVAALIYIIEEYLKYNNILAFCVSVIFFPETEFCLFFRSSFSRQFQNTHRHSCIYTMGTPTIFWEQTNEIKHNVDTVSPHPWAKQAHFNATGRNRNQINNICQR